jgi:hypothetical protein
LPLQSSPVNGGNIGPISYVFKGQAL